MSPILCAISDREKPAGGAGGKAGEGLRGHTKRSVTARDCYPRPDAARLRAEVSAAAALESTSRAPARATMGRNSLTEHAYPCPFPPRFESRAHGGGGLGGGACGGGLGGGGGIPKRLKK